MLLSFVKFQVKLVNFDDRSKSSAAIYFFLFCEECSNTVRWGERPCNGYTEFPRKFCHWNNFENRSTFAEVMVNCEVSYYFRTQYISPFSGVITLRQHCGLRDFGVILPCWLESMDALSEGMFDGTKPYKSYTAIPLNDGRSHSMRMVNDDGSGNASVTPW